MNKKRILNYYHLFSIIYLLLVVITSYGCSEINTDKKDTSYILVTGKFSYTPWYVLVKIK